MIKACDSLDGVRDGVIGEPSRCRFDLMSLVGTPVLCGDEPVTITTQDIEIVRQAWRGARARDGSFLWYGLDPGAPLRVWASTVTTVDGATSPDPSATGTGWFRYFLEQDSTFDPGGVSHAEYERLFVQSVQQYTAVLGTDDPDLSAFAAAGGKMITWHGQADGNIPSSGTIDYYDRVADHADHRGGVERFYRLFLAPGVEHCAGGAGPAPADPLVSLVDWVENHRPPTTLPARTTAADGSPVTRNLCAYPRVSRYNGHGDARLASSYHCTRGT